MYEFNGLPLHVLLVHFTVVIVPLAALCTVASVVWPAARRRLGIVTPLIALAALIAVPITTAAGQWLLERVPNTPLISAHAALGLTLLPWVIAVFVVALAQWVWFRFVAPPRPVASASDPAAGEAQPSRPVRRTIAVVIALAALTASVGATVTVVQIGEAGTRAVWQGSFLETP